MKGSDKSVRPLPPEDLDYVVTAVGSAWVNIRGKRIFITGGTGFFGLWLLETFCRANDVLGLKARATVLSRNVRAFSEKAPHLISRGDLDFCEGDARSFVFPEGQFSFAIHAATDTRASLYADTPEEMLHSIVNATSRVLDFVRQAGVNQFLLTSSGAVYGRQPAELERVPETFVGFLDPSSSAAAYGIGKRTSETAAIVAGKQFGFEAKIARCFAFVGPQLPLDGHFAIGNFIRDVLAGGPICVSGDGTPFRSYLYAADLAVWLWTILFKGEGGQSYNVGSADFFTIAEIAEAVRTASGTQVDVKIAQPKSGGPASRYVPDVSRMKRDFNLSPGISLPDAIRRTLAYYSGL